MAEDCRTIVTQLTNFWTRLVLSTPFIFVKYRDQDVARRAEAQWRKQSAINEIGSKGSPFRALSFFLSLSLSLSLSFYSFTVYALALVYEILTAEGDSLSRRLATSEYRHN